MYVFCDLLGSDPTSISYVITLLHTSLLVRGDSMRFTPTCASLRRIHFYTLSFFPKLTTTSHHRDVGSTLQRLGVRDQLRYDQSTWKRHHWPVPNSYAVA